MTRFSTLLAPVLLAPFLLGGAATAQAGDQEQLAKQRDKKLASEFMTKAHWITDFADARAAAKKSGKPIFAYFTRSFAA
jgi:hypothetical protein